MSEPTPTNAAGAGRAARKAWLDLFV